VKGQPEIMTHEPEVVHRMNSSASDISLQLKPAGKAVTVREPQTPSAATSSPARPPSTLDASHTNSPAAPRGADAGSDIAEPAQNSELDSIIDEAKRLQYMVS